MPKETRVKQWVLVESTAVCASDQLASILSKKDPLKQRSKWCQGARWSQKTENILETETAWERTKKGGCRKAQRVNQEGGRKWSWRGRPFKQFMFYLWHSKG